MAVKRDKIHFESITELLGAPVVQDGRVIVKINDIHSFENHPYKVVDDDRMEELVDSIRQHGVFTPVLIRTRVKGGYEVISGHRRIHASQLAGLDTIPAIIREMTDDEAIIAMVDSNVQRTEILPSEKAWALRMKMDAMRRQGFRSDIIPSHIESDMSGEVQNDTLRTECVKYSSADEVGEIFGLKARQVQKYIRLTDLIPELLDLVDEKKIPISLGVEIAYIPMNVQRWIYEYRKEMGVLLPTQIEMLKNYENLANISKYAFTAVMNQSIPDKKTSRRVSLSEKKLNRYFPARMPAVERERIILELLEEWKKKKERRS